MNGHHHDVCPRFCRSDIFLHGGHILFTRNGHHLGWRAGLILLRLVIRAHSYGSATGLLLTRFILVRKNRVVIQKSDLGTVTFDYCRPPRFFQILSDPDDLDAVSPQHLD